jgi:hypothetical protein
MYLPTSESLWVFLFFYGLAVQTVCALSCVDLLLFFSLGFLPQTDSISGNLPSVDDSGNLWKLIATANLLLDQPVSDRDFKTGKLVPIPDGGTNREALYRYSSSTVNILCIMNHIAVSFFCEASNKSYQKPWFKLSSGKGSF